jgi:hypothetical protein
LWAREREKREKRERERERQRGKEREPEKFEEDRKRIECHNNPAFASLLSKLCSSTPGANAIELFTAVIYRLSTVIPSFYIKNLYYVGNYCGMVVNYHVGKRKYGDN